MFSIRLKFVSVKHQELSQWYYGGIHDKPTSVKQADSVASRLSSKAIYALGNDINGEYP